ncbi:MAG: hypothetical protein ABI678_13270 [Kofleriaceae bacterium]
MRLLPIVAVLVLSRGAVAAPRAWSEAQFDTNVKALLAGQYPKAKITRFDDDAYRIERAPETNLEIRFTKAHARCREAWSDCEAAVALALRALDQSVHPGELKVSQLRVVLRATGKIDEVRRRTPRVATRPFSSDAQWMLAADMPDIIRLDITPELLKLSAADAWKTAIAGSKPTNVATAEAGPFLVYQHDYAPSALQFPALLETAVHAKHPDVKGHLLAVCPEENIVLYTIGGAAEIKQLRDAAAQGVKDSQMPLSTAIMEWRDGAWREVH